jgi:hypothetical protein
VSALNVENNLSLPPNGEFIRESFDRLAFHLGKIERSIESNLIQFEDVQSPMNYYVPFMQEKYKNVLTPYMNQLHQDDAQSFLRRFGY